MQHNTTVSLWWCHRWEGELIKEKLSVRQCPSEDVCIVRTHSWHWLAHSSYMYVATETCAADSKPRRAASLPPFSFWEQFFLFDLITFAFSALTLLVGCQEEHPACKNWVMRCWCGYLSAARCRLFAYGPADASASQPPSSSPASFKSILVSPFWYQLTQVVLEKRLLNVCSSSSSTFYSIWIPRMSRLNRDWECM